MTRRLLRKVKAKALRFTPAHPPVLVMGLRRGGSTMVADAISANRGVWFADEPFAMFPGRPGFAEKSARLFVPQHSHFFDLDAREQSLFSAFTHDLLGAQFRAMGTARQTLPGLKANRSSLKVLNAPWMLDWFASETEAHIIAMTRHPGAQARSVLRQGWGYPVEAYLARPAMLERVLGPARLTLARQIWENGDDWSRAILDWVVTSHPLRHAHGERVYRTSYEAVVAHPEAFIDAVLMQKCGLADRDAMVAAILRPSGSSHLNTAAATQSIAERNVDRILNGWRDKCSAEELARGQEILDQFDVAEYRFDD
jgi:hypothetical protein